MIDLNPSDLTCIYSTLHFVCDHARRYDVTPILTFDQPLWWKALTIVKSEPVNSKLSSVILRLGGFHTLMSFLGCIGHRMTGTGLKELLELVFASNTTSHMMSGKSVSHAIRGHLLIDAALNAILVSQAFEVDVKHILDPTEVVATHPRELEEVCVLYDRLVDGSFSVADIESSQVLDAIDKRMQTLKDTMTDQRTAQLWFQYMEMIDIVRSFLRSERTGDWLLNLQTLQRMLPYMAASGHNLYTKLLHIYLQLMGELPNEHPEVYERFIQGLNVVRRSDRFWAGLSTDLVIEQVLMRSLKTSGGLTRGRGMTETQRLVWVMSSPVCAEVNNALQEFTGVNYTTSDQHKDLSHSRLSKDLTDTRAMVAFLNERNPFEAGENSLHSIATGIVAKANVNIDDAKGVGDKILSKMAGERVLAYTFRKKDQAATMDTKFTMKTADGDINIDPQLLFQRLVIAGTHAGKLSDAMRYELCAYPPALFESRHALLAANKPVLASAIWNLSPPDTNGPSGDVRYVLDGGALLQRIPWQLGETYDTILNRYVSYIKRYGQSIVVFDGYRDGPSTKDGTHRRRGDGHQGRKVSFTTSMALCVKKEEFLKNKENKQMFIDTLGERLDQCGHQVMNASGDADLLIAKTAVEAASKSDTVLVGDDTDLLVLLCFHHKMSAPHNVYFMPEPKKGSLLPRKYLNIGLVVEKLGESVCGNILFAHAILGCDTTSRLFGIGKAVGLTLLKNNDIFCQQAVVFGNPNSTPAEIVAAGEKALVCIYKGKSTDTLDSLRFARFQEKVATNKASVHPKVLPPTSAAAKYHSLRVFHQVQEWKEHKLDPLERGWKMTDGKMTPVHSDQDAAPEYLIKLVRCSCKGDCSNKRCGCRSIGLECTVACSECKGVCRNRDETDEECMDVAQD